MSIGFGILSWGQQLASERGVYCRAGVQLGNQHCQGASDLGLARGARGPQWRSRGPRAAAGRAAMGRSEGAPEPGSGGASLAVWAAGGGSASGAASSSGAGGLGVSGGGTLRGCVGRGRSRGTPQQAGDGLIASVSTGG